MLVSLLHHFKNELEPEFGNIASHDDVLTTYVICIFMYSPGFFLLCSFPPNLATKINAATPLKILNILDSTLYHVFIAASPRCLAAAGRSDDLGAIVRIIDKAQKVSTNQVQHFPYCIQQKPS